MQTTSVKIQNQMAACLTKKGFSRLGHHHFVLGDIHYRFDHNWPILERSASCRDCSDPLGEQFEHPGLWKVVASHGTLKKIYEFPPDLLSGHVPQAQGHGSRLSLWEDALTWGIATAQGAVSSSDWSPPPLPAFKNSDVDLIIQAGSFVLRSHWIREDQRLAVRVPIVNGLPRLPQTRMRWLQATLLDAQSRWRLVRLGLDEARKSVAAELDFSGASGALIQGILPVCLTSLRQCATWLVATVDALAFARLEAETFKKCETLL